MSDTPGINGETFTITLKKEWLNNDNTFKSEVEKFIDMLNKYDDKALLEALEKDLPVPIIIFPEDANLPDLMQANPDLSKEELLYWCPEFKEEIIEDCPICKNKGCTNDGFACYKCYPDEYKEQTKDY